MSVEFFLSEGKRLGNRESMKVQIQETIAIAIQALQRSPLSEFAVAERMRWARKRITKYEEDRAYSLIGIFGVSMAVRYGEGWENAFRRWSSKIEKTLKSKSSTPLLEYFWIESSFSILYTAY